MITFLLISSEIFLYFNNNKLVITVTIFFQGKGYEGKNENIMEEI
jgi:hypothetical protein